MEYYLPLNSFHCKYIFWFKNKSRSKFIKLSVTICGTLLDLLLGLDHQYRVRSNGNILIFVRQVGNVQATYLVEIVPGASNRTNPIHYYPPSIAVPGGTTVT
jgi:hypothetical protein